MPAVKTLLKIEEGGKERTLKGKYYIDLGNAEVLFLVEKNKNTAKFLESNSDMSLHEAVAPNGYVVGRYIWADKCTICDMEFQDALIVVSPHFPPTQPEGAIGLKFLKEHPAIMDFDKKRLYLK